MRSEGVARWRKAVEFDLEGWRMAKRIANLDPVQRKSLRFHGTWTARVMEERTENVPGCC